MVCLSCRRASPAGSVYCGGCGRTFGSRICGKGHRNRPAPGLACCTTCGSLELTEATRYVPLRGTGIVLAGLAALGVWRWAIAHLALLGGLLWRGALDALAVLLDQAPCQIVSDLRRGLSWLLTLWLLGWAMALLPGRGGALGIFLRSLPGAILKAAARVARPLPRLLGLALFKLVWQPERTKMKGEPPKPG